MLPGDRTKRCRWERAGLFCIAGLGIALQLFQDEDRTPPYRYFTVWSATAMCVYASRLLRRSPRWERTLGVAGATGVVFSGAVYLGVIAPINGFGLEPATIAANLTLHVLSPLAVVAVVAMSPRCATSARERWVSLLLPAGYLLWVEVSARNGIQPAYVFLDNNRVGSGYFALAVAGGAALFMGTSKALSRLAGAFDR